MFTELDNQQLQQKAISKEQVNTQIQNFQNGFPYQKVISPAIYRNGITIFDSRESEKLVAEYDLQKAGKKIIKFVPASGAATRMFKTLFEHIEKNNDNDCHPEITEIINRIDELAFYDDLKQVIQLRGQNINELLEKVSYSEIIKFIISKHGLNYGNLPKGLLRFHKYTNDNRTALEEHLVEGALYAKNSDNNVFIHFTVSHEHLNDFSQKVKEVKDAYEKNFGVTFQISYSVQKPSTDTIAVDSNNQPFRNADGTLVFRPGGHGALLENLNDLKGEYIFIKNIDNIVPDKLKSDTVFWKKALAGMLFIVQKQTFDYLKKIELLVDYDNALYSEIIMFIESKLGFRFSKTFLTLSEDEQKIQIYNVLNRPIRICGMVKNTGEPGGGPFWVEMNDGSLSLQILESSQFNLNDETQKTIFNAATHFNPVDLVISTHNFKGEKFDLREFRDPDTGFISKKSKDGKELKALELPGLWNGSMAFWNTMFVEVPVITFNPVKTVNDLLRNEHQNSNVKIVKE